MDNQDTEKDICMRLMENSDFRWYLEKLNGLRVAQTNSVDVYQSRGEIAQSQYSGGVKRGLELALTFPQTIITRNTPADQLKGILARFGIKF